MDNNDTQTKDDTLFMLQFVLDGLPRIQKAYDALRGLDFARAAAICERSRVRSGKTAHGSLLDMLLLCERFRDDFVATPSGAELEQSLARKELQQIATVKAEIAKYEAELQAKQKESIHASEKTHA